MGLGLVKLLGDATLRERLAENAGNRVCEEFSPAAYRRKLLSFYEAVERKLERRASGGACWRPPIPRRAGPRSPSGS